MYEFSNLKNNTSIFEMIENDAYNSTEATYPELPILGEASIVNFGEIAPKPRNFLSPEEIPQYRPKRERLGLFIHCEYLLFLS